MYKYIPLSSYIRIKRLKWAGHAINLEDHRIPRWILGGSFGCNRLAGRSRSRWENSVQKDALALLHVRNWKSAALNRIGWRKLGRPWPEYGPKSHRTERERESESEQTPICEWIECSLFGGISCMHSMHCGGWPSSVQNLELNGRLVDKMHNRGTSY
jgi:hypothetical protein